MALRPWVKKYPKFMYHAMPVFIAPFVFCMVVTALVGAIVDGSLIFARQCRAIYTWLRDDLHENREELKKEFEAESGANSGAKKLLNLIEFALFCIFFQTRKSAQTCKLNVNDFVIAPR